MESQIKRLFIALSYFEVFVYSTINWRTHRCNRLQTMMLHINLPTFYPVLPLHTDHDHAFPNLGEKNFAYRILCCANCIVISQWTETLATAQSRHLVNGLYMGIGRRFFSRGI